MNTMEILKNVIGEQLQLTNITDIEIAIIETIKPLSIKLANDKILPKEFLSFIPKTLYLKNTDNELDIGTKIIVIKNLGGQQYIVLDFLEDATLGNSISTVKGVAPLKIQLSNNKTLERQDLMLFNKTLSYLRNTGDIAEIGKKLITARETKTGKYIFITESE